MGIKETALRNMARLKDGTLGGTIVDYSREAFAALVGAYPKKDTSELADYYFANEKFFTWLNIGRKIKPANKAQLDELNKWKK